MDQWHGEARFSLTALYAGSVWSHHDPYIKHFGTRLGDAAYWAIKPVNRVLRRAIGFDLESCLLQRHQIIDHCLRRLIEDEGVLQVLEIASGLSPRGCRFMQRYANHGLVYVEADLPKMSARKQDALDGYNVYPKHHIVACDAMATQGDECLETIFERYFDARQPVVVVSEGFVNYFSLETNQALWSRLAALLKTVPKGFYLSDVFTTQGPKKWVYLISAASVALGALVRGKVHFHGETNEELMHDFTECGFTTVDLFEPTHFYGRLSMPKTNIGSLLKVVKATVKTEQ